MKKITKNYVRSHIKKRDTFSSKNDYGHALIIAGNTGKMGAAVIAAKACLRSGVGLLTMSVPHDERFTMQTTIPEAMLEMRGNNEYNLHKFSAIGIGPGIGVDTFSEETLTHFMTNFNKPLLLDADVLTLLANNKNLLSKIPPNSIITPHCNEFDRLFGKHNNNTERINTAIKKANEYGIIIILKNHITAIISPDKLFYNTNGNSGLAKGGSGDALTGIITAFLAQGYKPLTAAKLGVYLHGLVADITLKEQSMESMLITDVIEKLGEAFKQTLH